MGELSIEQVLSLSRDGLGAPEIAKELSLPEERVKLVLSRHNAGSNADRDIDDEDLTRLRAHALALALGAENEAVQAKMTMYLIDRDKPRTKAEEPSNILAINQAIFLAQSRFKDLIKETE